MGASLGPAARKGLNMPLPSAMRVLYSAVTMAAWPLLRAKLWWRGRHEPLYREAVGERRGRYADAASSGWIWVHAVSLGETRAAAALVDALRAHIPGMRLLLTHGTATGRQAGRDLLRPGDRQVWLPWDSPGATRRFFGHHRPALGVLMETEVWPNLLHAAAAAGVPVALANARLSDKSLRQSLRLDSLIRPAARSIACVLAQTEDDARRLREAGVQHALVCGNLKFDMQMSQALLDRGRGWRETSARPVVLAASTREGEELALLAAWRGQPDARPRLLIVPRHPQRFNEVAGAIEASGFTMSRRSSWADDRPGAQALQADVWLGDSMGEMAAYYASADVALLGGSFAPLGGQNLIEAAACGCPVVMGPSTFNFAQAAELSLAAGAAERVNGIEEGVARATAIANSTQHDAMREAALRFAATHRGAADRMAGELAALLRSVRESSPSP